MSIAGNAREQGPERKEKGYQTKKGKRDQKTQGKRGRLGDSRQDGDFTQDPHARTHPCARIQHIGHLCNSLIDCGLILLSFVLVVYHFLELLHEVLCLALECLLSPHVSHLRAS